VAAGAALSRTIGERPVVQLFSGGNPEAEEGDAASPRIAEEPRGESAVFRIDTATLTPGSYVLRVVVRSGSEHADRRVHRARECIPLRSVLRFLRLSPSRFQASRRRTASRCRGEPLGSPRPGRHGDTLVRRDRTFERLPSTIHSARAARAGAIYVSYMAY
jgi:hypothetical protein